MNKSLLLLDYMFYLFLISMLIFVHKAHIAFLLYWIIVELLIYIL